MKVLITWYFLRPEFKHYYCRASCIAQDETKLLTEWNRYKIGFTNDRDWFIEYAHVYLQASKHRYTPVCTAHPHKQHWLSRCTHVSHQRPICNCDFFSQLAYYSFYFHWVNVSKADLQTLPHHFRLWFSFHKTEALNMQKVVWMWTKITAT